MSELIRARGRLPVGVAMTAGTGALGLGPPVAAAADGDSGSAAQVGERIRALRQERGLSQTMLGGGRLTKGFISQVESGRSNMSPESLQFIAAQLGVSPTTLLPTLAVGQQRAFLQRAANAAITGGTFGHARALLTELSAVLDTPRDTAEYHRLRGEMLIAEGDLDGAQEAAMGALHALRPDDTTEVSVRTHNLLGKIHLAAGRHTAALQYFVRGATFAERGRTGPAILAVLRRNEGTAHMRLGDPAAALRAYEQSQAAAGEAEDLRGLAVAHMGVGEAARAQGQYTTAIAHAERAVALLERLEVRDLVVQLLHNIGHAYTDRGDTENGRVYQLRALEAARAIGDRRTQGYALERIAALAVLDRKGPDAEAAAREAAAAAEEVGDVGLLALALVARAEASELLGRPGEADRLLARARRTARQASALELRQVLLRDGAIHRARGDLAKAAAAFEKAARLAEGVSAITPGRPELVSDRVRTRGSRTR